MLVPDAMRDCVAFLCPGYRAQPTGLAYYLARPIDGMPGFHWRYLMTSRRNLVELERQGSQQVWIRANRPDGLAWIQTDLSQWHRHPDPTVDAAAIGGLDLGPTSMTGWPTVGGVVTSRTLEADGLGLGDETFTVGLFTMHPGDALNEPIVRTGNLAGIPREPVPTENHGAVDSYLVETRSGGGLSGAPVFIHAGFVRVRDDQLLYAAKGGFYLLGHVHGDCDSPTILIAQSLLDFDWLTGGISLVVPIHRALEIFELDAVKEEEARALEALGEHGGAAGSVLAHADVAPPA